MAQRIGDLNVRDSVIIGATGNSAAGHPLDVVGHGRVRNNLYIGTGGGYFYNDSNSRIRTNQDFYTNNANTYLYGDNTYLGDSSGDNIYVRGNTISGDRWNITGPGQIQINRDGFAGDAITIDHVENSDWSFVFRSSSVGNDNDSGFWVGSNGYPDMRLRRENGTVRALISSWERSYVSNGFSISGGTLDINNNDIVGANHIFHEGDSDTYMQFHADNQWRVVTGGAERLEVNDTEVTVQNNFRVSGNTYLGNSNGDQTHINDTLYLGATDSGDAHMYFGENSSNWYGLYLNWDSGHRVSWYSRNAGTNTRFMYFDTNSTSYLNWERNFHMQNRNIHYTNELHFNSGTRFTNEGNNYLKFRSDSTTSGGIKLYDGGSSLKGYGMYWDGSGNGVLNSSGQWGLRLYPGSANTSLYFAGSEKFKTESYGTRTYGDHRVNTNLYLDQNHGSSIVGAYSSTRYQGVFAMGDAYKLSLDGTSPGTLYGLAWTHSNVGGQSVSGLGHQMLVMSAGTTRTAIGDGIWTPYDIRGGRFVDYNDTTYYLDPAATSNLLYIQMPYRGNGTENLLLNNGGSENWNVIDIAGGNNQNGIGTHATSHSTMSRNGMSFHVNSSDSIRFHSSGWDTLFEVAGSTGNAWLKGSLDIGGNVDIAADMFVTFYGNNNGYHGIGNRNWSGGAQDDIRINSYHNVLINLDSNSNNDDGIFAIGKHGQAAGTIQQEVFRVQDDGLTRLTNYTDGSDVFAVDGVNGRLFTVTDSLDDSLFSVNTIAGLPVMEAFADQSIKLGPFTAPVEVTSTGELKVDGGTDLGTAITGATVSNDTITFTRANGSTFAVTTSDANTNTWRPVDDTPVDGNTTTSISSNWAFDNVKTAVPANAVFTDTNTQLTDAQVRSKFSAGTNVAISATGVISATDTNTWRPVDDTPQDGETTRSISSNWAFDNVKTAVPANAVFTDTDTNTWRPLGTGSTDAAAGNHNHQGLYVNSFPTTNDDIDADWGQSFKTFDPIPSGTPPIQSPNLRTINVGDNFDRRTQIAFTYDDNRAWFRRRHNSTWSAWSEFIHSDNIQAQTVDNASKLQNLGAASFFRRDTSNNVDVRFASGHGRGMRFWDNDNYKIWMSSATNSTWGGRVGGETTSDYNMYFKMAGGGTNRGFVFITESGAVAGIDKAGNGRFEGDVVAYSASDRRLKDNLTPIENACEKVQKLTGYEFDWNDNQDVYKGHDIGVVAQEVEEVFPEIVKTRDSGYKAVDYEKLVAVLIEANKELQDRVQTLEDRIDGLTK